MIISWNTSAEHHDALDWVYKNLLVDSIPHRTKWYPNSVRNKSSRNSLRIVTRERKKEQQQQHLTWRRQRQASIARIFIQFDKFVMLTYSRYRYMHAIANWAGRLVKLVRNHDGREPGCFFFLQNLNNFSEMIKRFKFERIDFSSKELINKE